MNSWKDFILNNKIPTSKQYASLKRTVNTAIDGLFDEKGLQLINPKPIQLACLYKRANIIKLIGPDVDVNITDQIPPLHISIILNDIPTLVELVKLGVNKSILYLTSSPLHTALRYSDFSTFQYLFMSGFSATSFNENGDTVLHTAIKAKKQEYIQLLSTNKELLEFPNIFGQTPRMLLQDQQNTYKESSKFDDRDVSDIALQDLKKRVAILESAAHNLIKQLPQKLYESPGSCCKCKQNGAAICPVCKRIFCSVDWITHVMNGCKNSM
ncbi:hypothetical protein TVAG_152370 [Trichomonas vaginalis G3]|uniref:Uncharacterized protein n=1 Tax=Trichomonas vaginalis (strain ATCC PRA-98 / G3) TaxID=412133 RepID=A2F713_TRIV3|nr:hypothetical protein TVAG_152370 [Trichomonas vaginalis G3]|eukprot:XP_001312248.1 hypothetical protein [Trichomonas vaginalis G3]